MANFKQILLLVNISVINQVTFWSMLSTSEVIL